MSLKRRNGGKKVAVALLGKEEDRRCIIRLPSICGDIATDKNEVTTADVILGRRSVYSHFVDSCNLHYGQKRARRDSNGTTHFIHY